jgi:hypothetical protein
MLRFGSSGCNFVYKGEALVDKFRQMYLRDFDLDIDTGSKRWKGTTALTLLKDWSKVCYIQPAIMEFQGSAPQNHLEVLLTEVMKSRKQ